MCKQNYVSGIFRASCFVLRASWLKIIEARCTMHDARKSRILALATLLAISACGFQVIYADENNKDSHANELASVRIQKNHGRLTQEIRNSLYDVLNPDHLKTEAKYILILEVRRAVSSTFITSTGASGRNKVTLEINYTLKNLENAAMISNGATSVNDNYDVSSNRYGTYTAEEYVQNNLTKIAAQNIRNSLVNDLIEIRKKCDGKFDNEKEEKGKFVCPLTQIRH